MEASQAVSEGSQYDACRDFGAIIHRAAVRIGGKSVIARQIGVGKEVIKEITTGQAFAHRATLSDLVAAVEGAVHELDRPRMHQLVKTIKGES